MSEVAILNPTTARGANTNTTPVAPLLDATASR